MGTQKCKPEEVQDELAWQMIAHFNDIQRNWEGYFDCGKQGVLHIFWRRGWNYEYIQIEEYNIHTKE
jgi:hypothetical protein